MVLPSRILALAALGASSLALGQNEKLDLVICLSNIEIAREHRSFLAERDPNTIRERAEASGYRVSPVGGDTVVVFPSNLYNLEYVAVLESAALYLRDLVSADQHVLKLDSLQKRERNALLSLFAQHPSREVFWPLLGRKSAEVGILSGGEITFEKNGRRERVSLHLPAKPPRPPPKLAEEYKPTPDVLPRERNEGLTIAFSNSALSHSQRLDRVAMFLGSLQQELDSQDRRLIDATTALDKELLTKLPKQGMRFDELAESHQSLALSYLSGQLGSESAARDFLNGATLSAIKPRISVGLAMINKGETQVGYSAVSFRRFLKS